jgi:hypothetical protein
VSKGSERTYLITLPCFGTGRVEVIEKPDDMPPASETFVRMRLLLPHEAAAD